MLRSELEKARIENKPAKVSTLTRILASVEPSNESFRASALGSERKHSLIRVGHFASGALVSAALLVAVVTVRHQRGKDQDAFAMREPLRDNAPVDYGTML